MEEELVGKGAHVIVLVPRAVVTARMRQGFDAIPIDRWDDYTALADLVSVLEARGVIGIVTEDERCIRAAAFLRACLGLGGLTFEDAIAFTDKAIMKERLRAYRVPVADWRVVTSPAAVPDVAEELGWPVIVKPRVGFSAINTFVIKDYQHFARVDEEGVFSASPSIGVQHPALTATDGLGPLVDAPRGFLVEEFVDIAAEFHCELMVRGGEEIYCLPFVYPTPLLKNAGVTVGSAHIPLASEDAEQVREISRVSAFALGLRDGFAHAEVFRTSDGRWLLGEIGARPGGAQVPAIMDHQYGIGVTRLSADLALGADLEVTVEEKDGSVAWITIPAPTGVIVSMTDERDLRALPGVIDVHMELCVGDSASGPFGSLAYAGYVFCEAESTAEAIALARSAADRCRITVVHEAVT
ncbi:ATP-grasp domain-containing protein [Rathayibacter iranicus]|uniref:ATP-grasp domain-containing protein n=1 Tax=Rathayibacter iranicus TaxID=59737 RepID=UPI000FDCA20B|nr:ATP-grasp domain-containing protein [Rathayibacter iranicus]MWV32235.1 ATP-grasp domain-containing protein [Rathayibacter iranicus NCPPB 2253 = VKM Ac-1602]